MRWDSTHCVKTLADRVQELKETYQMNDLELVGDRGVLTSARLTEVSEAGLRSVTALTHLQILKLISQDVIQPSLFDEQRIAEIYDPDRPDVRYLLCRNPLTEEKISLFEADGQGKERRWTFSCILQRLKSIQEQALVVNDTEVQLKTTPDSEQQEILDLLGVKIWMQPRT